MYALTLNVKSLYEKIFILLFSFTILICFFTKPAKNYFGCYNSKNISGRKKMTVTDDKGAALTFARTSLTFLLNFFYFNGWGLSHSYHDLTEKSEVLF
jgi:hypothetical protein